jgi:hypothetical protein
LLFELQDRVIGLAPGVALSLFHLPCRRGLDVSPEILPWHRRLDGLQRIALGADRLQPPIEIKKTRLRHVRSHAAWAVLRIILRSC